MTETRFELCLAEVLRHEGGYADHPSDPGGATNMGITRKTLARWRGVSPWWNLPKSAVQTLSRAEAAHIYEAGYWRPCRAAALPPGMDLALFDFAVNSGPVRAIRTLQAVLGTASDGIVGPLTLASAGKSDARAVIAALCDRRLGFLRGLSTFSIFGTGWTRRVAAIRTAALKAAPASTSIKTGETLMDMLSGYKTYIVAALMLLAGIAQILGIDVPTMEQGSAGSLVLEALAILFLRRGLKGDIGRA